MTECREELTEYAAELESGTDDDDPEQRASKSTQRYRQDLRWFDHWLDDNGIESVFDVGPRESNQLGRDLSSQYNGTTPRYRWDRLHALYDYFVSLGVIDRNPLERWNDQKGEKWGMTKTTEQSKRLEDDEKYAVDQDDIRLMEENCGRNRVRNQLVIRLLWHTGIRRGEASNARLGWVDRDVREITIPSDVAKNGKTRVVCWQPSLDGLLSKWLDKGYREDYLGGRDHDHLLVGERGAPLSAEAINKLVINSADRAGINRKLYADANAPEPEDGGEPEANRWLISSQNVRHGTGSYLVHETDMGLYEVSRYLGHQSVEVTEQTYVEYDPRAGTDAAHKFGPA